MIDLSSMTTVGKGYALHNRLHAEYLDARHTARRKSVIQEDHEAVVTQVIALGGHHIPKGDALDDTLPQELRGSVKLHYLTDEGLVGGKPVQILRTGTFYHAVYGKFVITVDTLSTMAANFGVVRPKSPTEMVVDFEHLSASLETASPEASRAAGWVRGVTHQGEELFADIDWTDEAAGMIAAKQYRYISPEFDLNYKDKESPDRVGPTLISVALTNRPFLEGMEPVVLSERLLKVLAVEPGLYEQTDAIRRAYAAQFPPPEDGVQMDYVVEIFEGAVVVERSDGLFQIPYRQEGDETVFDDAQATKVQRVYQVVTPLSPEAEAEAQAATAAAARGAGAGEYTDKEVPMEQELRKLLGLDEDADVLAAVSALSERAKTAETASEALGERMTATEASLAKRDRDDVVRRGIEEGKLLPAQKVWADAYALKDPTGFQAYVETAPRVAPETRVLGGGERTGEGSLALSETELAVAKRLGIREEDWMKEKEAVAA